MTDDCHAWLMIVTHRFASGLGQATRTIYLLAVVQCPRYRAGAPPPPRTALCPCPCSTQRSPPQLRALPPPLLVQYIRLDSRATDWHTHCDHCISVPLQGPGKNTEMERMRRGLWAQVVRTRHNNNRGRHTSLRCRQRWSPPPPPESARGPTSRRNSAKLPKTKILGAASTEECRAKWNDTCTANTASWALFCANLHNFDPALQVRKNAPPTRSPTRWPPGLPTLGGGGGGAAQ